MINLFIVQKGRLAQEQVEERSEPLQRKPIWTDAINLDDEELAWIKEAYSVVLPGLEQLGDLEASARYSEGEDGHIHIRTDFLLDEEATSRNVCVAFVLTGDVFSSIHDEDLPAFRLVRMRARLCPGPVRSAKDVLMDLYATDAEYSTDSTEEVYERLGDASKCVLADEVTDAAAADVLETITCVEDLNGRICRNVMDTCCVVSFLLCSQLLPTDQQGKARQVLRDIDSIENHAAFLSDKVNFLMDATVDLTNINQNKIIKLFSTVSVALMPPTLIASIYGTSFKVMSELDWAESYPYAIVMMAVSAVIPLVYLRRKGWLK